MSVSKKGNVYVELDEELRTPNLKDASIEISFKITLGKKLESQSTKQTEKFMAEQMKDVGKAFKKFVNKQQERVTSPD